MSKKLDKALENMKGAILRFRHSLTRQDEEGWELYRETEYAFNVMVARARLLCGCQHCTAQNSTEPIYCCCSGGKQVECKCRR
ncbi:MAG: hypothetical protein Sv326_0333 [Candidatus Fermentimicrarchaeum limneticum]|uniref:Uncharacterized protein n=1 Tax=Fermentimicrarchaeum limneticum TaxID=2795018 RepID=A0A7D5XLB3_FERL1|nr:MAG: hypothetical protein Sv326_0333 [Candidatus Fermentimicrarchaeum limneticum]